MDKKSGHKILILGLGNILLSDEGAGIAVINQLCRRFQIPETIEVIDGGTMGFELADYFRGKTHIIIVDTVKGGFPAGTLTRSEDLKGFFQNRISPHQIGIVDVIALAGLEEDLHPEIVLFGIEPECLDTGVQLSSKISDQIDVLVDHVVRELSEIGVVLDPVTESR